MEQSKKKEGYIKLSDQAEDHINLSKKAKAYITKNIVDKITFEDHHQLDGFLSIFDLISYQHFNNLLGHIKNHKKLKILKRFSKESRNEHNLNILMSHLTRNRYRTVLTDKYNTRSNLGDAYYYAIEEIFKKMAVKIDQDYKVLNNNLVTSYPEIFRTLLSMPSDKARQKAAVKKGFLKFADRKDRKAVRRFFNDNKVTLTRLCVIPNKTISVEQTQELCITLHNYFEDKKKTDLLLKSLQKSKFVNKGGNTYFKPDFWANLSASLFGLFATTILTALVAAVVPGLAVVTPAMLTILTALAAIVVIVIIPLIVRSIVFKAMTHYHESKLEKHETRLFNEKKQFHQLAQRYGLLKADSPAPANNNDNQNNQVELLALR